MSEESAQTSQRETDRLMLHFGTSGPTELEIWHEDEEEATNITTRYPDRPTRSVDITKDLRRAGYELTEVDDG